MTRRHIARRNRNANDKHHQPSTVPGGTCGVGEGQLEVLCRQVRRLVLEPADRALLAVLSRSLPRQRWSPLLSEDFIEAVHQAVRLRPAGIDEDVQ
jgi:hypothetical protein